MTGAPGDEFEVRLPDADGVLDERPATRTETAALQPAPADALEDEIERARLGQDLAAAMREGGYHPVILFGTSSSGKTHLLLSLFALLATESRLCTGLSLCNPLIGASALGEKLHRQARQTFEVKTQAFIEGERAPATVFDLPFFIPVELRPDNKPPVRFAFMESKGEWYRPRRDPGGLMNAERLFEPLRSEIETFISEYQGAITFVYLAPFTQLLNTDRDRARDAAALQDASLAIKGVIDSYDRIRVNRRDDDHHLMLLTKWDEYSVRQGDRPDMLRQDPDVIKEFFSTHYGQAYTGLSGLKLPASHKTTAAYSAGITTRHGIIKLAADDEARGVLQRFPIDFWKWIYGNALESEGLSRVSPFPEPPRPSPLMAWVKRLLDAITG